MSGTIFVKYLNLFRRLVVHTTVRLICLPLWFPPPGPVFKIEAFNALQTRFGPSKYTSLKTTL
jgi:hypothetical protein